MAICRADVPRWSVRRPTPVPTHFATRRAQKKQITTRPSTDIPPQRRQFVQYYIKTRRNYRTGSASDPRFVLEILESLRYPTTQAYLRIGWVKASHTANQFSSSDPTTSPQVRRHYRAYACLPVYLHVSGEFRWATRSFWAGVAHRDGSESPRLTLDRIIFLVCRTTCARQRRLTCIRPPLEGLGELVITLSLLSTLSKCCELSKHNSVRRAPSTTPCRLLLRSAAWPLSKRMPDDRCPMFRRLGQLRGLEASGPHSPSG